MGTLLTDLNQLELAEKHLKYAYQLDSSNSTIHRNLGCLYEFSGNFKNAENEFKKCLRIDPNNFEVQKALSFNFFYKRDFVNFRKLYKSRLKIPGEIKSIKTSKLIKDHNDLNDFKDKNILIYPEQGIGDEVFFSGLVEKFISKTRAKIIFLTNNRLLPIFRRSFKFKIYDVLDVDNLKFDFDYSMPMGSLIEFIEFEKDSHYPQSQYLYPDKKLVSQWKNILNSLSKKPKIGISWKGGNNINNKRRRSINLNELATHLPKEYDYISLQYGDCEDEINEAEKNTGINIFYWDDVNPLKSIDQQFAQIAALDAVISIQNSTLHFAGSLGIKSLALLPICPDFRWRNNSDKSMFYESLNCLRQENYNDWQNIFSKLGTQIAQLIKKGIK
tara:strand:- start:39 stop:1199 length:1161 start_codon:yes stop_codon:yes gene_type:complete